MVNIRKEAREKEERKGYERRKQGVFLSEISVFLSVFQGVEEIILF